MLIWFWLARTGTNPEGTGPVRAPGASWSRPSLSATGDLPAAASVTASLHSASASSVVPAAPTVSAPRPR